jgi:hypothetical protein
MERNNNEWKYRFTIDYKNQRRCWRLFLVQAEQVEEKKGNKMRRVV